LDSRTHTALHVLKGAARKVLGVKWTAGVYEEGSRGRLTVQIDRKPTDEEVRLVEVEANRKVEENQAVEELEMDRSEAEARWGDNIYDLFPLPAGIKRLRILNIEGWNVNACKAVHTKTTGEVGSITILKARYRPARSQLEISFEVPEK